MREKDVCHHCGADNRDMARLTREPDYEPDYWEKLEHQYAGQALQARIIADQIRILQPAMVGPGDSSTFAAEAAEDARALIAQLKGDPVCEVCGTTDDAHLIAAAPDLLEALEEVTNTANSLLAELDYQQVSCPLCGEDPGEGEDALCGAVKALGEASSKARALIARLGEGR